MRCRLHTSGIGIAVVLAVAALGSAGANGAPAATGTLELRASLVLVSKLGACPPGINVAACGTRNGNGLVPGLGSVTEAYVFLADAGSPRCPAGSWKALEYPARLVVAGKGEIHFTVAEPAQCVDEDSVRTQPQAFTITDGTGMYVGASGSGTVEQRVLGETTDIGRTGRETWSGTLVVPGLEFDVTAPAMSGAVSKTVRAARGAKRARVFYVVTARDVVDGARPVSCFPRSGTWFPLGRTAVTCSAADKSGNTRTARFTVTVRRR